MLRRWIRLDQRAGGEKAAGASTAHPANQLALPRLQLLRHGIPYVLFVLLRELPLFHIDSQSLLRIDCRTVARRARNFFLWKHGLSKQRATGEPPSDAQCRRKTFCPRRRQGEFVRSKQNAPEQRRGPNARGNERLQWPRGYSARGVQRSALLLYAVVLDVTVLAL
jgi:hypothetical protein